MRGLLKKKKEAKKKTASLLERTSQDCTQVLGSTSRRAIEANQVGIY